MLFRQARSTKSQRVAHRRERKLRQRYGYQRSLRVEGLEDRRLLASGPILDYAFSLGAAGHEEAYDIARDTAGNIYVAGHFSGSVDFDPGPGANVLTSAGPDEVDAFVAKYTAEGTFVWAQSLGMITGSAIFYAVAVDSLGNVVAGGQFSGEGADSTLFSTGSFDGMLASFDANGNRLWTQGFGSGDLTYLTEVIVDGANNIYTAGVFRGSVDMDAGPGTTLLTSTGSGSGFVAKLDASGALFWAGAVSSDGVLQVNQLALDGEGNLFSTGNFAGTADFDPGPGVFEISSAGGFVLKLSQAGEFTWVRTIDNGQTDGIAIDSEDNIIATGVFQGTTDFDPGPGEAVSELVGLPSGFVWKLDNDGNFVWAKAPEAGGSHAGKVAVDSNDDIYVVGNQGARTDMDPGPGTFYLDAPPQFFSGSYIWKLDNGGSFEWARTWNGNQSNAGCVVDAAGNVYFATTTFSNVAPQIDFDAGPQGFVLTGGGSSDIAVARFSQGLVIDEVNLEAAFSIGGSGSDTAYDIARDAAGNIYIAGEFSSSMDFDPGPGSFILDPPSHATASDPSRISDAFIAKYTAEGDFVWATEINLAYGYANFNAISVDTFGNVFAGGIASGSDLNDLEFGDSYVFGVLCMFNANGERQWAQLYGPSLFNSLVNINDVAADEMGNVYMTGYYSGTVDFDARGGIDFFLTSPGDESAFVAMLNSNGNLLWAQNLAGDGFTRVNQLARDSQGNLLLTGQFAGTTDFDPSAAVSEVTTVPQSGFLLKLDQDGAYTWVRTLDGNSGFHTQVDGIALDAQNNIYAVGAFDGPTDFDPGPGVDELQSSQGSGFVWKLDNAGNHIWASSHAVPTYRVAVDPENNVYATGAFSGRIDFDTGLGTFFLQEPASGAYLSKFDSSGGYAWSRSLNAIDNYAGVAVDNTGIVYIAPTFSGVVEFDPGPHGFVVSSHLSSQGETDLALVTLSEGVVVVVNPDTINDELQDIVSALQSSSFGASPPAIVLPVTTTDLTIILTAVEALAPNTNGPIIEVVLNLADGDYAGETISLPTGVRLVIDGTNSTVTFEGASPAFTVNSGEVAITGVTFVNTTDAPTILVTSGSLILRNSFVQETTGGNRPAIEITGGSVDLGTLADPGGNTIDVSGPGELVRNLSTSSVSALGNEFQADGSTITDDAQIENLIFHGLDNAIYGVVDFGGATLFVGVDGNLQGAIDAAPHEATIFVAPGVTGDFDAGAKLLTIAFENGPTISQLADEVNPNLRTLTVIGTPGDDVISFNNGPATGVVQAAISGVPTGSFRPNGRLIAYGEDGHDEISVNDNLGLSAILYGGEGNDDLSSGSGNDLLFGGNGNDNLTGASGNDFLIGGAGADRIVGASGHDVLVAGEVATHLTPDDLLLIAQQWAIDRTADDDFADDVFDELAEGLDKLTGSSGADWFIVSLNDKVTDFKKNNKDGDVLTLV
jgi:Ca2+-binding RTX toxin-like protein